MKDTKAKRVTGKTGGSDETRRRDGLEEVGAAQLTHIHGGIPMGAGTGGLNLYGSKPSAADLAAYNKLPKKGQAGYNATTSATALLNARKSAASRSNAQGWRDLGNDLNQVVRHIPGLGAVVRGVEDHQSAGEIAKNFFSEGAQAAIGGPVTTGAKVAAMVVKDTVKSLVSSKLQKK